MHEVETNPVRNLLLITFRKRFGITELALGRAQVAVALEGLAS